MTRVLITGMSGTGKSSVVERLVELGYTAVDADQPEWSHWAPVAVPGAFQDTEPALDWVWRETTCTRCRMHPAPTRSSSAAAR